MTPKQELLKNPNVAPVIASWYEENIDEDATVDDVGRAMYRAMELFTVCDCPRPARTVKGAELAEWTPAIDELVARLPSATADGFMLEYVRMCPDWPGGCEWIEGTPGSLAGRRIYPVIVHPRCAHPDCPGTDDHRSGPSAAVSDHKGVAGIVPSLSVPLQVGVHLGLEPDGQHPLGTAAADLVQGEGELLVGSVLSDYPEHRRTSFRRRHHAGTPISGRPEGTPRPSPGPASTTFVHNSAEHSENPTQE
jgi:hypothetical protein